MAMICEAEAYTSVIKKSSSAQVKYCAAVQPRLYSTAEGMIFVGLNLRFVFNSGIG